MPRSAKRWSIVACSTRSSVDPSTAARATTAIITRAIALNELGAFDAAERAFREAADLVEHLSTGFAADD